MRNVFMAGLSLVAVLFAVVAVADSGAPAGLKLHQDEPIKKAVASPAIPAGGRELVSNASAEELKGGLPVGYTWNGTAAKMEALAKVEIVADAHTGSNAICVTRLNEGGKYSFYPPFDKIAPSDIPRYYRISVWMKGEAAGSLVAQIQCADSKWGKAYDSLFDVYAGWKQYSLPIQVNPRDDVAHLRINFMDALVGDKLFMDDFSMREIGLEEFTQIAALQKKMKKTIPIQDGTCFIFTGEGKPVAVIWMNPDKPSLKLELPANAVQVIDCMGNMVPPSTEMVSAKISIFPLYIQGLGSLDELTDVLTKKKL